MSPQDLASPLGKTSPFTAAASPGSTSSLEIDPLTDQLLLSVLKGRKFPRHPSELPLSPMLEREPPRSNQRVSIDLRPMVELISPRNGTPTIDQDPTGKSAPASVGGRSTERAWPEEKRVHVFRPVLKVRPPPLSGVREAPSANDRDFGERPLPDDPRGEAPILSAAPYDWSSSPDDVDSVLSLDALAPLVRRASSIRRPRQPHRRGSRVSPKECPGRPPSSTTDLLSEDVGAASHYKTGGAGARRVMSRPAVCATEDCVEHARHILRTLDASANPCLSFHAYVCGGGGSKATGDDVVPARRLTRSYASQIVLQNLLSGNSNSSTAFKAHAALSLCLSRSAGTLAGEASLLAHFMRKRGLTWPVQSRVVINFVDVLAVLIDLSVNWNAALWFDVRIQRCEERAHAEDAIIVLGEPGHVPLLRMEQLSDLDESAYESTARAVARYLLSGSDAGDTEDPFEDAAALKQLHLDEKALREAILTTLGAGDDVDVLVVLRNAGSAVFEGVSLNDWATLLDNYLGASAMKSAGINVSLDTKLLVLNGPLFAGLSRLTSEIPAARLLDAVSWMFSYSYAWIENRLFDRLPPSGNGSGSDPVPDLTTRILCAAAERAKVTDVLKETADTLVETVTWSRGVSNATKSRAGDKITAHTLQTLWPPQPFQSLDVLDTLYTRFPSSQRGTFYESWLESRRAQRASLVRRYYAATLMTLRLRWYAQEVLYVYSLNRVVLGLAAVFPPSYRRQGSPAMTYAGIGFQFARKLVSSIDMRGRFHDYDGTSTGSSWWEREPGSPECRLERARSTREANAIGDLFALDVSLAAMKKVSGVSPLRLKLLEKLTGTQVFYVSYCNRFCDDLDAREKCDLAMNGSEFRAAFDCQWRVIDRGCLFV
ncbi:hypothetical protein MTO96_048113 [Rhipicephalus appendiculatus]